MSTSSTPWLSIRSTVSSLTVIPVLVDSRRKRSGLVIKGLHLGSVCHVTVNISIGSPEGSVVSVVGRGSNCSQSCCCRIINIDSTRISSCRWMMVSSRKGSRVALTTSWIKYPVGRVNWIVCPIGRIPSSCLFCQGNSVYSLQFSRDND